MIYGEALDMFAVGYEDNWIEKEVFIHDLACMYLKDFMLTMFHIFMSGLHLLEDDLKVWCLAPGH